MCHCNVVVTCAIVVVYYYVRENCLALLCVMMLDALGYVDAGYNFKTSDNGLSSKQTRLSNWLRHKRFYYKNTWDDGPSPIYTTE